VTRVAVIVDGYSTGRHLSPTFRQRGWDCVHVQSRPGLMPFQRASFTPRDYLINLRHDDGHPERTVAALEPYQSSPDRRRACPWLTR
jgi:hypothetical protein